MQEVDHYPNPFDIKIIRFDDALTYYSTAVAESAAQYRNVRMRIFTDTR